MIISVQTKTTQILHLAQYASKKLWTLFWLAYFFSSIALYGMIVGFGFIIPFALLSWIWSPFRRLSDLSILYGTRFLLLCQPWYKIHIHSNDLNALLSRHKKFIFVANHRSHLDVFILLTIIPGARILAKKALFSVPFLGLFMRVTKQIPVHHGRIDLFMQAMALVKAKVENGELVIVFPELTRCPAGFLGVQNFSSAPFKIAKDTGALVIPVAISNTDQAWPKGSTGISFRKPITLSILSPLEPSQFENAEHLKLTAHTRIHNQIL